MSDNRCNYYVLSSCCSISGLAQVMRYRDYGVGDDVVKSFTDDHQAHEHCNMLIDYDYKGNPCKGANGGL